MKISKHIIRGRVDRVREIIPAYGYFFKRGQEKMRLTNLESQPRYNRANTSDFIAYHVLASGIILAGGALGLEKLL